MRFIQRFFATEASSGIVLMFATVLALAVANSPLMPAYEQFLYFPLKIDIGGVLVLDKSMEHWINDGLMALFFLLIGLEIKRELVEGELSTLNRALLPAVAAAGGVLVPALIYLWFNDGTINEHGWAIPCATDIAFSLGILALFGSRLPVQLKIFLMAVAVIDDLMAVLIIALFYTSGLDTGMLLYAFATFVALLGMNMFGIKRPAAYILVGLVLWLFVLKSGVHATVAGVLLGLVVPLRVSNKHGEPVSRAMENGLHPWVAYFVIPVFAFANAGVPLTGFNMDYILAPLPLGIILGLFVGKQLGIFAACYGLIKLNIAPKPPGVGWGELYGTCVLAGVGFTMSLFIGGLAFDSAEQILSTRFGVITGSLFSALFGYIFLSFVINRRATS